MSIGRAVPGLRPIPRQECWNAEYDIVAKNWNDITAAALKRSSILMEWWRGGGSWRGRFCLGVNDHSLSFFGGPNIALRKNNYRS